MKLLGTRWFSIVGEVASKAAGLRACGLSLILSFFLALFTAWRRP